MTKKSNTDKIVYNKKIIYDDKFDEQCGNNKFYKFDKLPHIMPKVKNIYAVGDLHGDYDNTIKTLKAAKLINDKLEVIQKDFVFVNTGDLIDRCRPKHKGDCEKKDYTINDENSDVKILELFYNLNKKAKKKNGMFICLLGNHEVNNVYGDMRYVSYQGAVGFKDEINPKTGKKISEEKEFVGSDYSVGIDVRKYLFAKGNKYAKFLACARQTIVIIGGYLFVHASVLKSLADNFPTQDGIKHINVLVREWLLNLAKSSDEIPGTDLKIKDLLLNNEVSPLLPRNLGYLEANLDMQDEVCMKELYDVYKTYKIYGIIIGHTPQSKDGGGISLTCTGEFNGKKVFVARVDNGISQAFDNFYSKERVPEVLRIRDYGKHITKMTPKGEFDIFEEELDDLSDNDKFKIIYDE